MTEVLNETTRSIQSYRHEAKGYVRQSEALLAKLPHTPATKEIHVALDEISKGLNGSVGLSQTEQVARLADSLAKTKALSDTLVTLFEVAKSEAAAMIAALSCEDEQHRLVEALDTLDEAQSVALQRDFAAWQEKKGRGASEQYDAGYDDAGYDDEEDEDKF